MQEPEGSFASSMGWTLPGFQIGKNKKLYIICRNEQIQIKMFDSIGRNQFEGLRCVVVGQQAIWKRFNLLWNDLGWSDQTHKCSNYGHEFTQHSQLWKEQSRPILS